MDNGSNISDQTNINYWTEIDLRNKKIKEKINKFWI